ncbi:glutathione peroxidase [Arthrobacter sp. 2MCAF15]|uniref:glutathione peroxidase n=1 Tax=Arthrobacter sp. 2MCAF15 TaxID=3232984 RepID=UPI003F8DFA97
MSSNADIYECPIEDSTGNTVDFGRYRDKLLLIVNVASRCGLTDQYRDLQKLQEDYSGRGFTVVAFPCNQFNGQEPGTAKEVKEFCSITFGADFPVMGKIEVNGPGQHPLYELLTATPDDDGKSGDVEWNFEKFVIAPEGAVLRRVRPRQRLSDPEFVLWLEDHLSDRPVASE